MTGDEWIARVFEPALRVRETKRYPELLGALSALAACGVLSEQAAAAARQRVHDELPDPLRVSEPEVAAPTRPASGVDVPRALLAPLRRELADADGIAVALTAVELWTRSVVLHVEGLRSALRDELDAECQTAADRWMAVRKAWGIAAASALPPPPEPHDRVRRLRVELDDDLGTRYRRRGSRSSARLGGMWASRSWFEPGVPDAATRLILTAGAPDDARVVDVALPRA